MIKVENLTKKYGEKVAVSNVSFEVEEGRIWGFLGPNGAGKTTTMRTITGYLPPTEGKVSVAGLDPISNSKEVKTMIGYLPENPPLYQDMTVESYLKFVAKIKGVKGNKIKENMERVIEKAGLREVRGRLIRNLSKGYKQRVGIAQALIHEPKVLILDEPTIGLDPAQIREIRDLIKSLRKDRTIILSTHILAEVTQVCDGVVIINEGKIVANGYLEELTSSYAEKEGVFLRLRNFGPAEKLYFENIDGVTSVYEANGGVNVEWKRGLDLAEKIAKTAIEKGMGLIEMRSLIPDIETIYLKAISQ
ncbi:MAG: ABC transporter ATP-binding protein [Candidatus Aminicenantia bacterium]